MGASGLEALGVVVDANGDASTRWDNLRERCTSEFSDLPDQIPAEGLEVLHSGGQRFGIWIMPDNRLTGMLEDWLVRLIPEASSPLFELAGNCVSDSKRQGAPFKEAHRTKAEIHTWLAWQDEPGLRLYDAIIHRVLNPGRPASRPFVNWFRSLFRL